MLIILTRLELILGQPIGSYNSLDFYVYRRTLHLGPSKKNTRLTSESRCRCKRQNPAARSFLSIDSVSRANTIETILNRNTKRRKRCPLRIAELAVPTKRQCIETWRTKSDVLPGYMVRTYNYFKERSVSDYLKQEQRIIVRCSKCAQCTRRGSIFSVSSILNVILFFQVERLKQHVMDQTPIANITEAIHCFQTGGRGSLKT